MGLLIRNREQRTQSSALVLAQLLAIGGKAAAFPSGQAELAKVVREAPDALTRQAAALPTADLASQRLASESQVTVASIHKR